MNADRWQAAGGAPLLEYTLSPYSSLLLPFPSFLSSFLHHHAHSTRMTTTPFRHLSHLFNTLVALVMRMLFAFLCAFLSLLWLKLQCNLQRCVDV